MPLVYLVVSVATLPVGYQADSDRVLVVDDDPPLRRMLARTLTAEGYAVTTAGDGGTALTQISSASPPDLIVLDVTPMPGLDGLAVCWRLRAKGVAAPVLMLTARDSVADRVDGLEAGADDYLVKPFAVEELIARCRALSRRGRDASHMISYGDLRIDSEARRATRPGRDLELTGWELALSELLARDPGRCSPGSGRSGRLAAQPSPMWL